jgi:hypothetical protein
MAVQNSVPEQLQSFQSAILRDYVLISGSNSAMKYFPHGKSYGMCLLPSLVSQESEQIHEDIERVQINNDGSQGPHFRREIVSNYGHIPN